MIPNHETHHRLSTKKILELKINPRLFWWIKDLVLFFLIVASEKVEIKARLSRIISEEMREREQQETPSSYNVNVRINYLDLHLSSTDLFKVQKFINHIRLWVDFIDGRIYFSLFMAILSRDVWQWKEIFSSTFKCFEISKGNYILIIRLKKAHRFLFIS